MSDKEINNRVIEFATILKNEKIIKTWAELCEKIEYTPQNWSKIMNGDLNVPVAVIGHLSSIYGANLYYLILGIGDIFVTKSGNFNENNKPSDTNLNPTKHTTNDPTKPYKQNEATQIVNEPEVKYSTNSPKTQAEQENSINVVVEVDKGILLANKTIKITLKPRDLL